MTPLLLHLYIYNLGVDKITNSQLAVNYGVIYPCTFVKCSYIIFEYLIHNVNLFTLLED